MKQPFMSYYEHIAKLAVIANKQTIFLSHLLGMMEYDGEKGVLIVDMNPKVKRRIIKDMEIESKNPLRLASQYLDKLQKAGLVKSLGGGRFLIDPSSYSYGRYVPKNLRNKASYIFSSVKFERDGDSGAFVSIDSDTGEVIEL